MGAQKRGKQSIYPHSLGGFGLIAGGDGGLCGMGAIVHTCFVVLCRGHCVGQQSGVPDLTYFLHKKTFFYHYRPFVIGILYILGIGIGMMTPIPVSRL